MTQTRIEKLVYGGDGLTRLESGQVVFVPWSAPGDVADVEVLGGKPVKGQITELLEPASIREKPPCSVFGTCGGCQWQHIQPEAQREWKRAIVVESLQRLGKLNDVEVGETLGAEPWHYRNHVQWKVQPAENRIKLGYYQAESHELTAFDHCWIIPEAFTRLAHWLEQRIPAGAGVENIHVRSNRKGEILILLEGRPNRDVLTSMVVPQLQADFPECIGLVVADKQKSRALMGRDYIEETLGEVTFRISAQSFFQTNLAVTQQMLAVISDCLPEKADSMLDLYAGVGTFALSFKDRAHEITAIESAASAIADAKQNISGHGHIEYIEGEVSAVLAKWADEHSFDIALMDPPRAGCTPDVLDWVSANVTRQLIYVSCNPTTLARDLKHLVASGWRVERVQPLDMFPQTYHIECVVSLKKA